uniref:Prolyl 4-hydroxylase alpha subunit Fe(2+) 2OG dioxygenase domain-containing protein n=1 Tax=Chlamydomonas euryale TaxID=1486919 RepID=A0A7R9VPX2_9CHLO|mmetsp:Transcript_40530/g.120926  ORF Transcript_40530/g.120926 Transcript_40530/m.120926 type:complete len:171 (+) Transcript_40530:769-1281(+)
MHPRRGDALLFWNIDPNGMTEDMMSMHEGCSVIKGVKWTTTFWIHAQPFRPQYLRSDGTWVVESSALNDADDPGLCLDYNNDCVRWAAGGECEKNPVYMLGVASASGLGVGYQRPGTCRQACKFCQPCSADDRAAKAPCYWENRRDAGFLGFDPTEETAGAYQGGVALTL